MRYGRADLSWTRAAQRLPGELRGLLDVDAANAVLDRGDRGSGDAERVHAEADQDGNRDGIGGDLAVDGHRGGLAWHGANHTPDNIVMHLPDHDTLMLIDIVNPGWAPIYLSNLTEDIPGYLEAPANALA